MVQIALLNKKGSSLIEVLIALGILAVVAVALMQSSIIVLQKNVQNEMRDEAVRLAEQRMNEVRSGPGGFYGANGGLDLVIENITFPDITRQIRSATASYSVTKDVVGLDADTKQVTITVRWSFRGQQYTHSIMSIVRRYV